MSWSAMVVRVVVRDFVGFVGWLLVARLLLLISNSEELFQFLTLHKCLNNV